MGKFVIYKTATGYNFSLYAANQVKLCNASGVYKSINSAKALLDSISRVAGRCLEQKRIADTTLQTPSESPCPKFELYLDKAGLYRFRLIAENGEMIAICEEGYKSKQSAQNALRSMAENAANCEIVDETTDKGEK